MVTEKLFAEGIDYLKNKCTEFQLTRKHQEFIQDYLEKYYKKYSTIKTFLHGDKTLDFKNFYYPLYINKSSYSAKKIKNSKELCQSDMPNYITITGDAGGGKSTYVKNMFMDVV